MDLAERGRVSILPQLLCLFLLGYGGDFITSMPGAFASLCGWLALVAVSRALIIHTYSPDRWLANAKARGWLYANVASASLGWGLFLAAATRHHGLDNWNFTLVLLHAVGIAAGSLATLVSNLPLFRLNVLAVCTPVAVAAASQPNTKGQVVAFGLVLYGAFLLFQGKRLNRSYRLGLQDNALLQVKLREIEHARREAERTNRAKTQFLANISHELRTPMNGLLGMTELALETRLTTEQRDYLEMAHTSGHSLLNLLNEILDLSCLEAGRLEIHKDHFDLHTLLADVRSTFLPDVIRRNIAFDVHVDPAIPRQLIGGPDRIRQVLVNLVENALKFTEQGSILVEATLNRASIDKAAVEFSVHDTGIGIPQEMHQAIFDPFVQVDGTMSRRHGGAGLGLAVSSRIVALMGGRIQLESGLSRGSSFRFSLALELPPSVPRCATAERIPIPA